MIAIDIGSNTVRAVLLNCDNLKKMVEYEKIVRTAEGMSSEKKLSELALKRVIEALKEIQKKFPSNDTIKAVATAAFREAENQEYALFKIKTLTGIEVEVIDADIEAFYTSKAAEHQLLRFGLKSENFLLCDIGGASTELIYKNKQQLVTESFEVGILTLSENFKTKEEIRKGLNFYLKEMKNFLDEIYGLFGKPARFVVTGGTPTTIAAIKKGLHYFNYKSELINGSVLFPKDLNDALNKLLFLKESEKIKLVGSGREDLMIAGVVILDEIMKIAGFDEVFVSDDGLREGVAIVFCEKYK